jgi:DNA repair exonuclease SbcCD ATPase subunit
VRPISLKLKNVFQHEDLEFEFKPGITGVVGRNGSGKSNLLEALYFAISGKTGSDITKLDMLGWKGSAGSTEFRFEYDGVEYALTRNLHSALVSLSGKTLAKPLKNAEANAQVEAMLGTDPSSLYETCWTPQGGLVQVLVMSHAQRVAFFQRLADIRKAEVIRGMLQDSLNQLPNYLDRTEDIRKLAEEREGLHAGLVALENTNNALEDMHRQFKDALPDCQKILGLTTEDQYLALQKEAAGRLALQQSQLQTFLTRNVLEEVPAAEPPSREMEQSRYQVAQRGKLQAEMKDLQSRHDHLLAPACAQPPDEFRKEVQMREPAQPVNALMRSREGKRGVPSSFHSTKPHMRRTPRRQLSWTLLRRLMPSTRSFRQNTRPIRTS